MYMRWYGLIFLFLPEYIYITHTTKLQHRVRPENSPDTNRIPWATHYLQL